MSYVVGACWHSHFAACFSQFNGLTERKFLRPEFFLSHDMCIRMLTGVYICTLHDLEMGSPNDGESVEIIDDSVGCPKTPGKALIKSLSLLFLQNKLPF